MSESGNKLRVKADPHGISNEERKKLARNLAGAIAHSLRTHGEVSVRCVGNPCIGKGSKALAISKEFMASHNLALYCAPAFITIDMEGQERTGITFYSFTDEIYPKATYEDDVELWVKSDSGLSISEKKDGVKKLAGAIAHNLRESGSVKIRCFGNSSIGKAAKAMATARGYVAVNGIDLYCSPYFIVEDIGGEEKTGIGFQVFAGGGEND